MQKRLVGPFSRPQLGHFIVPNPSFAVAHSMHGDAANAFHQYWNIAEKLAQQVTPMETIPISIPASIPQMNFGIDSVQMIIFSNL